MIAFIWIEDEKGLIGKDGGSQGLPWVLPNDLKHFAKITKQGDIVMGRTTYESMTNVPLKGRKNIIMTRNKDYVAEGAMVVHSKEEVLEYEKNADKPVFVIGGADVFKQFLDEVDVLYRTVIHGEFEGDTYFPELDWSQFELVESFEGELDEKNTVGHTFERYERVK